MIRHNARTIDLIVIHHSASDPATTDTGKIRSWHLARGWNDIGYHRVIESDGFVMDGRPIQKAGAHAPPNANRLGICGIGWNGNEDHPEWGWTDQQWGTVLFELDYWCRRFDLALICGHNQTKATLCPGVYLPDVLQTRGFAFMDRVVQGDLT